MDKAQEYLKIYKLVKKYEQKAATCGMKRTITFDRIIKKVEALVKRAQWLEECMMVDNDRRWTGEYV